MLQNYNGPLSGRIAVENLSLSGHLWTLPLEFFFYFFAGAFFFLLTGKGRLFALVVLGLTFVVAYSNFSSEAKGLPAEGLSILWLLGFGCWFVVYATASVEIYRKYLVLLSLVFLTIWLFKTTPGDEYRLQSYFSFALSFLFICLLFMRTRILVAHKAIQKCISFFAGYSYSLYLLHLPIMLVMVELWTFSKFSGLVASLILTNLVAILFSFGTERHYKVISKRLILILKRNS